LVVIIRNVVFTFNKHHAKERIVVFYWQNVKRARKKLKKGSQILHKFLSWTIDVMSFELMIRNVEISSSNPTTGISSSIQLPLSSFSVRSYKGAI